MATYPSQEAAAKEILKVGRKLERHEYVVANDGNISVRIGPDEVLATPTGVSKGEMKKKMLSVLSLDGAVLQEGTVPVSSEVKMHLRVYRENPELRAVVHAHPVTATSFAAAGIPLDESILTEALMAVGSIPVAHYALPGSQDVPDSIAPFCTTYNGALLANHGVITWADSLQTAWFRMQWVECYAQVTLITKYIIGGGRRLSEAQAPAFDALREKLGVKLGGAPLYGKEPMNTKDVYPRSGLIEENETTPMVQSIARAVTKSVLEALQPREGTSR